MVLVYTSRNFQKTPQINNNKKTINTLKQMQLDHPQKTDETPHPKETPTTLLKCTNQNTQARQPYQTGRQQYKSTNL